MSYSTLPTVNAGDPIASATWGNIVKANEEYLFSRPAAEIVRAGSADYTTTSTTFADVDATNLKINLVLAGTRAFVQARFMASFPNSAGNYGAFDLLSVGLGTRKGGTNGLAVVTSNTDAVVSTYMHIWIGALFTGLTPGSNDFKLQFRSSNGSTVTIRNNAPYVIEMHGWEI